MSIFDGLFGSAKNNIKAGILQPTTVSSDFGGAAVTPGGVNLTQGVGSGLTTLFNQIAQQGGENAANAAPAELKDAPFDLLQALGGATGPNALGQTSQTQAFGAAGTGALNLGQQFQQALQGYSPDAFAKQEFDRLTNIAGPADATAANGLADRLFAGGRLGAGDSNSGAAFSALAQQQSQARDARALTAEGAANTQTNLMAQLASMFSQQGAGLAGAAGTLQNQNIANTTGAYGAVRGDQLQTTQAQQSQIQAFIQQLLQGQGGLSQRQADQIGTANVGLANSTLATNARLGAATNGAAQAIAGANATGSLLGAGLQAYGQNAGAINSGVAGAFGSLFGGESAAASGALTDSIGAGASTFGSNAGAIGSQIADTFASLLG